VERERGQPQEPEVVLAEEERQHGRGRKPKVEPRPRPQVPCVRREGEQREERPWKLEHDDHAVELKEGARCHERCRQGTDSGAARSIERTPGEKRREHGGGKDDPHEAARNIVPRASQ